MATVSGWGQLKHGGTSHPILQKADVPIIPLSVCQQAFRDASFSLQVQDDVLCAGGGDKDACKGILTLPSHC